jgi:DNA repair exonuclease SbcCD ATPase subunit
MRGIEHHRVSMSASDHTQPSGRASQRPHSPYREQSKPSLTPRPNPPGSPSSLDSRTTVSAESRSPFTISSKPLPRNSEPIPNLKASDPSAVAAKPESRDPRLLARIITSETGPSPNVLSPSLAGSPGMIDSVIDGTFNQAINSSASSALQATGNVHPSRQQNLTLPTSMPAPDQYASPATRLLMLLGSLFEHASDSAALKHDHRNAEAKAAHQANLDKRIGDLSKSFPAYAESSAKAKKHIEENLAVQRQKLVEYQQAQKELLSSVPEVFHALMSVTTEKERQQTEMVKRCISIYENFKSDVDDVKQRFEQHKQTVSEIEKAYKSMESRVRYSTSQMQNLSSKIEVMQAQCVRLDDDHHKLDASVKLSGEDTRNSLASLKNDNKESLEQKRQLRLDIQNASSEISILKQSIEGLESQHQILLSSEAVHSRRSEELNKLIEVHSFELKELKAVASQNNASVDAARSDQHIQDLHQELSDARIQREELSALRTDFATLKTEFLGLKDDGAHHQNSDKEDERLSNTGGEIVLPSDKDDVNMKTQASLMNLEVQMKQHGENIAEIQQQLLQRQKMEEERDDLVVAQVEENKALTTKVQAEVGQRIESLGHDMQRLKVEGSERAQKLQELQDHLSQLLRTGSQISNSRISPISTPPTPQLNRVLQPQSKSSSPQPLIPGSSDMVLRRLEKVENLLSATALAHRHLDYRYNNISSEPVVRAMVQQMQWLYPFASEAQQEIAHLKQTAESFGKLASQLDRIEARIGVLDKIEARIGVLEREMTGSDGKHHRLIERVREEGKRLVGEVESRKDTVNSLLERVQQLEEQRKDLTGGIEGQKQELDGVVGRLWLLEQHRDAEPDKLKFITDTLAKKWEAETSKTIEDLITRLNVLETSTHQSLLDTFTDKIPAATKKAVSRLQDLHDNDENDTDDSSLPLLLKSKSTDQQSSPGPPPPTPKPKGLGDSFLRTRATPRKRKRYGNYENIDRSDDETYAPPGHSSSSKRKHR